MLLLSQTCIKPNPDFSRLENTLRRRGDPRCVPFYELFVNTPIMERVTGLHINEYADTVEFYYQAGYDYTPIWPVFEMVAGSLVDRTQGYPISDWKSFEDYRWPRPESVCYEHFDKAAKVLPDGMKIIGQMGGIFEMAQSLVGYEQLCYMLVDDPELLEAIFARLGALFENIYITMSDHRSVGAVVISDDMGYKTQTLIGADDLRKYVLPYHVKMCQAVHRAGKPCILHSCGQLVAIMDDIIDKVGVDAKHSYEDAILPVEDAWNIYGDRIAVLGGFDMDKLCRSSEDEIRYHTTELIEKIGTHGGYALGSGNSIAEYVPVENYLAMLDQGWRMRY